MMMQRPLGELLIDLADGMVIAGKDAPVTARSVNIAIPIDVRIARRGDENIILGDAPIFLTRTAFDPEPAKLSVRWEAIQTPMGDAA